MKAKFVSLLNLRRLLNLLQGIKEEYLDILTTYDEFEPLDADKIDISDLVSFTYDGTLVSKLSVDQPKFDTLQRLVAQSFLKIIERIQATPHNFQFGNPFEMAEPSEAKKAQAKAFESSNIYQSLKKEISEANLKIQSLQNSLKTRDEHLEKMKATLLKDVVHLRETVPAVYGSFTGVAPVDSRTKTSPESTTSPSLTLATILS